MKKEGKKFKQFGKWKMIELIVVEVEQNATFL
jgi:hypothetical protein